MTEAAIAPLAPPAVGKFEHAVAPVEAHDADGMAAEELGPGLRHGDDAARRIHEWLVHHHAGDEAVRHQVGLHLDDAGEDRKSTRLNSSHLVISYAVFCLKKKKTYK